VGSQPATRSLFTGSTLPTYERYAAYAVQVIAFLATALAAWRLRSVRRGAVIAISLVCLTYFVLLPLRLSPAGEAGAGRVSTFQWVGIAVLVPLGLLRKPSATTRPLHRLGRLRRLPLGVQTASGFWALAAVPLLFLSLVGNYGASVNAAVRFPGAFQLDSTDGRDTPLGAVQLAQRFLKAEGPGRRIAADSSTLLIFQAYAFAQGALPDEWEFFVPGYSSSQLEQLAEQEHITAIVVDDRLAADGGETASLPGAPGNLRHPPITSAILSRLSRFDWLRPAYRTAHYTLYLVDKLA
jgi:hypothetical protein